MNSEAPKKPALEDNDKDHEMIEIKDSDDAEKVIEVMRSNTNNSRAQKQACQRLCHLAMNDGMHRYRRYFFDHQLVSSFFFFVCVSSKIEFEDSYDHVRDVICMTT